MPRIALPGAPLSSGATALRPWRDSDIDALVELCQDPEISRWTRVPSPYRRTDARAYLLHRYDLLHAGASAPFAIVEADTGAVVGSIALMRIDWDDLRAEVGYWLGGAGRGRGHATRALRAICAWGFAELGLQRISLHAATGNVASQAVAERGGFIREAVLRAYLVGPQGPLDMVAYGRLVSDPSPDPRLEATPDATPAPTRSARSSSSTSA